MISKVMLFVIDQLFVSVTQVVYMIFFLFVVWFFFSSRRRHTIFDCDWSQTCALPICRAGERWLPAEHLVSDHTDGVQVGSCIHVDLARRLLRRHVGRRADGEPERRECAAGDRSEERRVGKECRSRWWPYH